MRKDDIERFERRLNIALPPEYRAYLLAGAPWDKDRCALHWGPGGEHPYVVEVSEPYRLKKVQKNDVTLEFMLKVYSGRKPGEGRIPQDAIAVAGCGTLEEILLFVRGHRGGQVWLKQWSQLEESGVDEPECGVHFVARDFRHFLESLREREPFDPDLAARVFVYVPDPKRLLFKELLDDDLDDPEDAFAESFQPAEALAAAGAGKLVGIVYPGKEDPFWRFGFEGENVDRMVRVLLPVLRGIRLPKGSFVLPENDVSRRVDL